MLTAEMKRVVREQRLGFVATVNAMQAPTSRAMSVAGLGMHRALTSSLADRGTNR
jgi:hypothetical protein